MVADENELTKGANITCNFMSDIPRIMVTRSFLKARTSNKMYGTEDCSLGSEHKDAYQEENDMSNSGWDTGKIINKI